MAKITNKEIKKYIDKMQRSTARLLKGMEERERMNRGFAILMDNEYGEDGWINCDYGKYEVITKEERDAAAYVIKNNRVPQEARDVALPVDVEVKEFEAEETPEKTTPTEH